MSINLTLKQANKIVESFGGDDQVIMNLMISKNNEGHSGQGIYIGITEYPEEGSLYIGEEQ